MELLSEGLILALAVCLALSVLAFKYKQPAVMMVSSIGVVMVALDVYTNGGGLLILALMITLAFAQTLMVIR